jgi:hypothetical protein
VNIDFYVAPSTRKYNSFGVQDESYISINEITV